jgi:DNA-binding MarR family transcriptional regulator
MRHRDAVDDVLAQWHAVRPDLDVSPVGVFGRLRRASSLALRELESFLRPHNLSSGTFDVLANLRRGGPPFQKTPSELAASTLLTTGAITGRLDVLTQEGLIERVPHPRDRRVMYARLTAAGAELIDHVFSTHLEREHRILTRLTAKERDQLANGLAALERALAAENAPADKAHRS